MSRNDELIRDNANNLIILSEIRSGIIIKYNCHFSALLEYRAKILYMKRKYNLYNDITLELMKESALSAFVGHGRESQVKSFRGNFDENCKLLYNNLINGSWKDLLKYRKFVRVNSNGKIRNIDSPSLITRIYQHLFIKLVEPIYKSKDNYNGLNCKKGCGITSSNPNRSIIHKLKHIFYDRRNLTYYLVIDQRKCYDHISIKVFRRMLKNLVSDKWFIDFAVDVCFINGKLPIGTPTSPLVHHIIMLTFDHFVKEISPFSIRYADDNFLAFYTKEDANEAKWRIKNFWWYELSIRSNRRVSIRPFSHPCDFCGYVFHRNDNRSVTDHNKGYTTVRRRLASRALKCNTNESWSSYFGILRKADSYSLMTKIEKSMKLRDLTQKIRINRSLDADNIDIKNLIGATITIHDYEIRYHSTLSGGREPNWIKCLIGIPEIYNGLPTGKVLAREFHGNYQGIITFLLKCESEFGKDKMLPIEEVEIENQCGYIIKGSNNKLIYIN